MKFGEKYACLATVIIADDVATLRIKVINTVRN